MCSPRATYRDRNEHKEAVAVEAEHFQQGWGGCGFPPAVFSAEVSQGRHKGIRKRMAFRRRNERSTTYHTVVRTSSVATEP